MLETNTIETKSNRGRRTVRGLLAAGTAAGAIVAGAATLPKADSSKVTEAPAPATVSAPDIDSTTPTSIRTVRKGDTAWGIAEEAQEQGQVSGDIRKTVHAIAEQSDQNGNLQPGQKVVVPLDPK